MINMPLERIEMYLASQLNLDRLSSDEELIYYLSYALNKCRIKEPNVSKFTRTLQHIHKIGTIPSLANELFQSYQHQLASASKVEKRMKANHT